MTPANSLGEVILGTILGALGGIALSYLLYPHRTVAAPTHGFGKGLVGEGPLLRRASPPES